MEVFFRQPFPLIIGKEDIDHLQNPFGRDFCDAFSYTAYPVTYGAAAQHHLGRRDDFAVHLAGAAVKTDVRQTVLSAGVHTARNLDFQVGFLHEVRVEFVDVLLQDAGHFRRIRNA